MDPSYFNFLLKIRLPSIVFATRDKSTISHVWVIHDRFDFTVNSFFPKWCNRRSYSFFLGFRVLIYYKGVETISKVCFFPISFYFFLFQIQKTHYTLKCFLHLFSTTRFYRKYVFKEINNFCFCYYVHFYQVSF